MADKTSDNSQSFPTFEEWQRQKGYDPGFQPINTKPLPANVEGAEFPSFDTWLQQKGYGNLFPPEGITPPEPPPGEFSKGVSRGIKQTGALLHGAGAAIGDLIGAEEFKQARIDDYQRLMKEAEQYPAEVASVEDIDSAGKFLSWAAGMLGEQLPNVVGFAVSGGFGAVIGKLAAKKAVTGLVAKELEKKAAQWATRGALASGYAFSTGLEAGGNYGEQLDANLPTRPGVALAGGAISGVLEMAPVVTVARMLGFGPAFTNKFMQNVMQLPLAKRMLASGALVGGQEATTELLQEIVSITAREIVDENYEALGPEGRSRMLNAAAGGGIVGTVFGGLGGVRRHTFVRPEEDLTNVGEPVEPPKQLPAPEVAGFLPAPQKKLTGPTQAQEIPDLVFSEKTPYTEVYTIGEEGIQNADQPQQKIITDLAEAKPSDMRSGVDQVIAADTTREKRGSIYTPEEQPRKGTLYANIPTKGNARRYGKSIQSLVDAYNKVINDRKSYVSEAQFIFSGKMTQAAKRRLSALERAIRQTSDRTGIQVKGFEKAAETAPVGVSEPSSEVNISEETIDTERLAKAKEKISAAFSEDYTGDIREIAADVLATKNQAQRGLDVPGFETLTPAQQNRVNELIAKDNIEGLSERETSTLERLITRAELQSRGLTEEMLHQQAKDKTELDRLAQATNAAETVKSDLREDVTTGMSKDDVRAAIKDFLKELKQKPDVRIANSLEFANTPWADQASKSKGLHIRQNGQTKVFLIEDNLPNADAALKTLMHEVLAHYGLRAMFSPAEMTQILKWIHNTADGTAAYKAIEERYAPWYANENNRAMNKDRAFQEIVAEEYVANIASTGTNMPLLKRIIAKVKQWIRSHIPASWADRVSFSDNDIRSMLQDIHIYLRGQVINNNLGKYYVGRDAIVRSSLAATEASTLVKELGEEGAAVVESVNNLGSVWGVKFKKLFLTPLQMAEQYGLTPVKTYIDEVQKWWATKMEIISKADMLVHDWRSLGADEARNLARALFEISTISDEEHRRLGREEVVDKLTKEYRLGDEAVDIYFRLEEDMNQLVNRLESGMKYNAARESLGIDPTEFLTAWNAARSFEEKQAIVENFAATGLGDVKLLSRMIEIENQIGKMRDRNYFPRMRFGQWTVAVRAKKGKSVSFEGETFTDGDMIVFETFENQSAAAVGREVLEKEFAGEDAYIQESKLSDEEFSFIGLPPALFDMIETELQLSPEQKEALKDIYLRMSPGRSFLKHLRQRKGIAGYSEDAMRVYATYMMSAANNLARVEHHLDMQAPLEELGNMQRVYREYIPNNRVLVELTDYFRDHYKYLMNPKNDWAKWRALGFLWYLGANPKSALVNATQIPMVTYPYLASKYGDAAAMAQLTRAYKDTVKMLTGKGIGVISLNEDKMFEGLMHEGVIDESQVTEIAGIAEAPTLFRVFPEQRDTRMLNTVSYYAGFMFRQVEKYNRRVTALTAFRLAEQNGANYDEAYQAAKKAVQTTQYEYAKWNRPKFMRGKKSVLFLFWQYMQHTTYLMFGGQGQQTAMRIWMMMLLASGMMGLPFAENLLDLLDFGGTKMKQALGMKNPKVQLRDDLRELLLNITDRPDIFMHGLGRYYGLGPLHILEALGVPIPNVDISGSISLGRAVPGLQSATQESRNPDEKFGKTMIDIMGPVAAMGYNLWKMVESNDPDTWKRYERAMPIAMKNASKAIRYSVRGQETLSDATSFMKFDPQDPEQMGEVVAQGLGFTPQRLRAKYELRASQEEARRYWLTRRATIMQMYGYAQLTREGRADAKKALRKYNTSVPDPRLKIRQSDIMKSLKQRRYRKSEIEAGRPTEKRLQNLYHGKERLYPEATE